MCLLVIFRLFHMCVSILCYDVLAISLALHRSYQQIYAESKYFRKTANDSFLVKMGDYSRDNLLKK